MKFKKVISVLFIFGFLSIFGLCLPKGCCKSEFKRNVEDIVRNYLRGQLNRNQLVEIYGDRLKEINIEENQAISICEYDLGCYEIKVDYSDMKSKNDDVNPEAFCIYAKDEDEEGLPISVFFDLCGKEDHYQPHTEITRAVFKYTEGDSPFIIKISVKNVYVFEPRLKNGSGRMIELTRYPQCLGRRKISNSSCFRWLIAWSPPFGYLEG